MKAEVAADIRAIFTAATWIEANALLTRTIEQYAKIAKKLAEWMASALPAGLMVFSFPAAHRQRLRTVNGLERFNQEIRRRTRVVGGFPNEASCLRLVSALAMETSDAWEAGNTKWN